MLERLIDESHRFFTIYNAMFFGQAMAATFLLSAVGCIVGSAIGLGIAVLRRTHGITLLPLRFLLITFVEFFRRVPVLVILMLVFFAFNVFKIDIPLFIVAVIGMSVVATAFMAEIIRAGIDSIHHNQWDAAAAMNFGFWRTIIIVIMPQSWKVIVPPAFSFFLVFIKDTAFASQIGVLELTYAGRVFNQKGFSAMLVFGTVLILYFVVSYPLSHLGTWLEARLAVSRHH